MRHRAQIIVTLHTGETITLDGTLVERDGIDARFEVAVEPVAARAARLTIREDGIQQAMRDAGPVAARIETRNGPDVAAPVSRITKAHICVEYRNSVGSGYERKHRRDNGREISESADRWYRATIVNLDELNALAEANGGTWKRPKVKE